MCQHCIKEQRIMYEEIKKQTANALEELIEVSKINSGKLVVIGCSSSEIVGKTIGKGSSPEAAVAVAETALDILKKHGLQLAAQCCEHLNRALIVERDTAERLGLQIVNVRPVVHAGGSFATAVYDEMTDPVAVEFVKADAGLDIGSTLIGMHLMHVAVPVRLSVKQIGNAYVTAARTRAKYIGGCRAQYTEE